MDKIIQALDRFRWRVFHSRPMTDDEIALSDSEDYRVFECELPDDCERILVSNGIRVWEDVFYSDGGLCLEFGGIVVDGMAWMPMPEPHKEGNA